MYHVNWLKHIFVYFNEDTVTAAALRGVALTRGRTPVAARALGGVYTTAAAAGFRHATPLATPSAAFPYAT